MVVISLGEEDLPVAVQDTPSQSQIANVEGPAPLPVADADNTYDNAFVVPKDDFAIPQLPGDGFDGDMWERIARDMASQLRDEIRQGLANASDSIVKEIKQEIKELLTTGSFVSYSVEEVSKADLQSPDVDSTAPEDKDDLGHVDEEQKNPEEAFGEEPRFRRSSIAGFERYKQQVAHELLIWGSASLHTGHVLRIKDAWEAATKRFTQDEAYQRRCLYRLVHTQIFDCLSLIMILANAAWMGYESDHRAAVAGDWRRHVDLAFNLWFTLELILKIVAFRAYFFIGLDRYWNLLDLFLVICTTPEYFSDSIRLTILRILRLARLTRAFRVLRLLQYLGSLREILVSLVNTLASLFWSFVAMILATYVWALLFLQSLEWDREERVQSSTQESFTSLKSTMMTMFACIGGGMEWYPFVEDFELQGAHLAEYAFLIYVFFMTFGLVNVVIGVFCARANEVSSMHKDLRNDREQERQTNMIHDLVQLFNSIDTDKLGFIVRTQFLTCVAEPEAQTTFRSYGLPMFALEKMWRIMAEYDDDPDERVSLVSFVMAFMRVTGNTMCTEVMILSLHAAEMRTDIKEIGHQITKLEQVLSRSKTSTSSRVLRDTSTSSRILKDTVWIQSRKQTPLCL